MPSRFNLTLFTVGHDTRYGEADIQGAWRSSAGEREGSGIIKSVGKNGTASVVYWSEFLATDTEVSGSIPGATRFSE